MVGSSAQHVDALLGYNDFAARANPFVAGTVALSQQSLIIFFREPPGRDYYLRTFLPYHP